MAPAAERRLLQAAVALGCLSPLYFGLKGAIAGPAMLGIEPAYSAPDLISHYRYLSGLLFALGLVLASCVQRIEARGRRLLWAAAAIMVGGLARLAGIVMGDAPSSAHHVALAAELGLPPALVLWQARVARRFA